VDLAGGTCTIPAVSCPACESQHVRPSRPRGGREAFLRAWSQSRYHECKDCGWRGRIPRGAGDSAKGGPDLRFWTVSVLVGLGFVYVLFRVG
jgi:hypothetical protein